MSVAWSLDEIARTSEDAAVRARFDAATLSALRVLSVFGVAVAFAHFADARTTYRILLGATAVLLAVTVVLSARKKATFQLAHFVRANPRGVAIGFVLIETALLMAYYVSGGSRSAMVFAVMVAAAAMFFRLLPAEHVLLHAGVAVITVTAAAGLHSSTVAVIPQLLPPLIIDGAALAGALGLSRRLRRRTSAEWSERRASAREQIRMRDELRYARELQLSMLPEREPELAWADVAGISTPATEVGGDYYDYFVEEGRLALVCGDVAGHGMASGLVLAGVRAGFALMREALHDPAAVLRRLQVVVTQTSRRRMLVTIAVVLLDRDRRRATIASAGHPPVLLRRADGVVSTIDLYTTPLGTRLPVDIPQRHVEIATGDLVVLHSDGVYETRNAAGEVYGFERLQRVVAEAGNGTARELRDAIVSDVAAFRGELEQDDDVTVVVCRVTG